MRIEDPDFDGATPGTRDAFLVAASRRQIAFMRFNNPFWNERLSVAGVHEDQIETLTDLGRIPIFSNEDLRALRPAGLLPKQSVLDLKICRWTSGPTGRPTDTFWTETDWAALVGSTARMLSRRAPVTGVSAFNGYSQAHLTAPLYSADLRTIGAIVFDRSDRPEDQFPTPVGTWRLICYVGTPKPRALRTGDLREHGVVADYHPDRACQRGELGPVAADSCELLGDNRKVSGRRAVLTY